MLLVQSPRFAESDLVNAIARAEDAFRTARPARRPDLRLHVGVGDLERHLPVLDLLRPDPVTLERSRGLPGSFTARASTAGASTALGGRRTVAAPAIAVWRASSAATAAQAADPASVVGACRACQREDSRERQQGSRRYNVPTKLGERRLDSA